MKDLIETIKESLIAKLWVISAIMTLATPFVGCSFGAVLLSNIMMWMLLIVGIITEWEI